EPPVFEPESVGSARRLGFGQGTLDLEEGLAPLPAERQDPRRAASPRELGPAVHLLAARLRRAGHREAADHAAAPRGLLETAEARAAEARGQIGDREAEAQVRPVAAVARDRLGVGEARERIRRLDARDREDPVEQALDQGEDVLL